MKRKQLYLCKQMDSVKIRMHPPESPPVPAGPVITERKRPDEDILEKTFISDYARGARPGRERVCGDREAGVTEDIQFSDCTVGESGPAEL